MHSTSSPSLSFFYEEPVTLRNRNSLKLFLHEIFRKEKKKLSSLNYIFCSDKRVLEINRQFLQHDYYTDIITFELSPAGAPVEGEIYISIDRVKDNARQHDTTFTRELHRVIFHGVLHLCGYKDKSTAQEKLMREKEDYYLNRYFAKK
ncbi:rRNA maturation RNase YbeY [Terrimonas sp. NA20]|uniref:Endoribonuclease YbeY n=1 Tax=Terrimonas ginsenosidimutans TaxID=2908004 RepID=A0ABS9KKZ1_9BACT|nr:rRNA maturation RNase YbeY [Terrimonas ginsenosidimutans]MCG2612993.1 rRNA maturation RNase YbeY [Terrimonas ginsenosidimutans]